MKITIFNEFHADQRKGKALKAYPNGLHSELKEIFSDSKDFTVILAKQEDPSNGLTDSILDETDVLIWWSDIWNDQILSDVSEKVYSRILDGMGAVFLYGGCNSKPFKKLMGTNCNFTKISGTQSCNIISVFPNHFISSNIKTPISFSDEKILAEPLDIPRPDELVFINGYSSSNVLRSGCAFYRGKGKIFYFYAGSDVSNAYLTPAIKQIIYNACHWASPIANIQPALPKHKDTEKKKKTFFFNK